MVLCFLQIKDVPSAAAAAAGIDIWFVIDHELSEIVEEEKKKQHSIQEKLQQSASPCHPNLRSLFDSDAKMVQRIHNLATCAYTHCPPKRDKVALFDLHSISKKKVKKWLLKFLCLYHTDKNSIKKYGLEWYVTALLVYHEANNLYAKMKDGG